MLTQMLQTPLDIFNRYEAIKHRLPFDGLRQATQDISSLLDLTDAIDAFVFDAFGVLNVGEAPIPGAVARIDQLRAAGAKIRVLTNAASYNQDATTRKFERLGFSFKPEEIITSRMSALAALDTRLWGVIAANDDTLNDIQPPHERLGAKQQDFDGAEGFLFLSTSNWSTDQQVLLERSLEEKHRRIVIANADLAAPRGHSFSIEPGFWGHQIADKFGIDVEFHGKPFQGVFDLTTVSLGDVKPDRIALCGDSLHTDILGANAAGWKSVFVTQDGLFNQLDPTDFIALANIHPRWKTQRI
jgi:HAD superfamily hydrolase (TIGR01450 family)